MYQAELAESLLNYSQHGLLRAGQLLDRLGAASAPPRIAATRLLLGGRTSFVGTEEESSTAVLEGGGDALAPSLAPSLSLSALALPSLSREKHSYYLGTDSPLISPRQ